ncbi:hypothetical protein HK100_000021 [Physocladia obscura]|uniref:WW domain-containing protein n=1 Tax=Physocladia obscura TaxID=109957 RepID=A0AAD5XLJ5_9FUNG|nr:hypothetical protein HK100_000021 [Physocladia obscura]
MNIVNKLEQQLNGLLQMTGNAVQGQSATQYPYQQQQRYQYPVQYAGVQYSMPQPIQPQPVQPQQIQPQQWNPYPQPQPPLQATPLPPGWIEQWDSNYQRPFYVEIATKRSIWERPVLYNEPQTPPPPPLFHSHPQLPPQQQQHIQPKPLPPPPSNMMTTPLQTHLQQSAPITVFSARPAISPFPSSSSSAEQYFPSGPVNPAETYQSATTPNNNNFNAKDLNPTLSFSVAADEKKKPTNTNQDLIVDEFPDSAPPPPYTPFEESVITD